MVIAFFDYLAVATLAFLSYGVFVQWWHIYKTKSAKDILMKEVVIRFLATLILFIKFVVIGDIYLIIGQGLFLSVMLVYLATLLILKLR